MHGPMGIKKKALLDTISICFHQIPSLITRFFEIHIILYFLSGTVPGFSFIDFHSIGRILRSPDVKHYPCRQFETLHALHCCLGLCPVRSIVPALIGFQCPSLGAVKVTVNVPGRVHQRNTYRLCLLSVMERSLYHSDSCFGIE